MDILSLGLGHRGFCFGLAPPTLPHSPLSGKTTLLNTLACRLDRNVKVRLPFLVVRLEGDVVFICPSLVWHAGHGRAAPQWAWVHPG